MNDQKNFWNKRHLDKGIFNGLNKPTAFAKEALRLLKKRGKILDLGCGLGYDAALFAKAGHTVIATDFAEIAINKNRERFKGIENLQCEVLDMSESFRFSGNEFDLVYARLSLHYFTDASTRKIISEIHRVLKPDGYLCFLCKSTRAPIYGEGDKVEKDMYELKGHVRHFFSKEYAKSLMNGKFHIEIIESGEKKFYGNDSAFVKVLAQKIDLKKA